jgi:hypothetical protein
MFLKLHERGKTLGSVPLIAEPIAYYSGRTFLPLSQAIADFDEVDGEFTLPPISTMIFIVISSALVCFALFAVLAWIGDALN